MRTLFLIALVLYFTGCASKEVEDFEAGYPCDKTIGVTADDGRPDILVIGDSISIGYTPFVQAALPAYDVSHNICNGMSSKSGVRHIDEWLNQRPTWDAVTFNHGLWDVASWMRVPDAEYRGNLHYIAQRIKAKTNVVIFITTTEVLPGTPHRLDSDVARKNQIAIEVMQAEGITVLDLYAVSQTIRHEHTAPDDVHYTDAGSEILGDAVAAALAAEL